MEIRRSTWLLCWVASGLAAPLLGADSVAARKPVATVTVDVRGLDDASHRRIGGSALERALVLRFVREGFAVVAPNIESDIRLAIEAAGGGLRLTACRMRSCASRAVPLTRDMIAVLQLEILHKAIALVRGLTLEPKAVPGEKGVPKPVGPTPEVPPVVPPLPGASPAHRPEVPKSAPATSAPLRAPRLVRPRERRWSVSTGFGIQSRLGGSEGTYVLGARARLGRGWGLHLDLGLALPADMGTFSMANWYAQLGISYRLWATPRLWFEAGARIGASIMHVTEPGIANLPATFYDLLVSFPGRMGVQLSRTVGISVYALGGFAPAGRDFLRLIAGGESLRWYRGAGRFESGVVATFEFGS